MPLVDGKLLIVGRPATKEGAATWLRCKQHLDFLVRQDLAHCPVAVGDDDEDLEWKALCMGDVFVSNGWPTARMMDLAHDWISRGKKWVWDLDDDPLSVSPYNSAFRHFGLEEVPLDEPAPDGRRWLWKDGFEGFDLKANHQRQDAFMKMLGQVSAITTTTDYLATKIRRLAPSTPIYIRPNVLDFEEIWTRRSEPKTDTVLRILYQGGSSHDLDMDMILPALKDVAERYPHVRFVFLGDTMAHAAKMLPEDRIEHYDWTGDYETYAIRAAKLRPDIAVAPLYMGDELHAEFNRCKSCLKWLDAAALGIPCVATWETPYQEVINFGSVPDVKWNGMLAKTLDDWRNCLGTLIENPEAREVIGNNAYHDAVTKWNAADFAPLHLGQYEEIVNGNHHAQN